jgi:hypothetical protein
MPVVAINARRLIQAVHGSKFSPPRGGWNRETFSREGHGLIITLARVAKITQRKAIPEVAGAFSRLVRFQAQEVINIVRHRMGNRASAQGRHLKAEIEIVLPVHEDLWARAIAEVFSEQGDNAIKILTPPIQSVMAQGYSRTSILFGQEADPSHNAGIARRAQEMTREIVKVNDTTAEQMRRVVAESIRDGLTVAETTAKLLERVEGMTQSRALTIARTEVQTAWTEGAIQTFREARTLTHCSVIGCESRETDRWDSPSYQQFMFAGQSTCNIQDVPVHDLDQLNFHPNHTGVLVPSRFTDG